MAGDHLPDSIDLEAHVYHYPANYLIRTYHCLSRFGTLPKEGGLDDQDARWLSDIDFMRTAEFQIAQEYKAYRVENGLGADGDQ